MSASSQRRLDGQLAVKAVDGHIEGYPADYTREWATLGGHAGSWLRLAWSSPLSVSGSCSTTGPTPTTRSPRATLRFSDGSTLATGSLPNNGSALTVNLGGRTITSLELDHRRA